MATLHTFSGSQRHMNLTLIHHSHVAKTRKGNMTLRQGIRD